MDERIFVTIDRSDHLEHHGIKGQKWGIRRFQNKNGTWTSLGKRRRLRLERKEAAKQEKERLKREKQEREKQEAILLGDPKLIKKHMASMTNQELQQAINRSNMTMQVDRLNKENSAVRKGNDAIRDVLNLTGTVIAIGTTGVLAYDTYAKLSQRTNYLGSPYGFGLPEVKDFTKKDKSN